MALAAGVPYLSEQSSRNGELPENTMFFSILSEVFQQSRLAVRQLRMSPGFTATVLLTLAIGMTAATVIFSLVDAVLLRPLALPEPDRLISLDTLEQVDHAARSVHGGQGATVRNDTSYPNFFDWRNLNKSFSSMAAYTTGGLVLGADTNGPARRLDAAEVSSEFFKTLGVMPEMGRDFTRVDELPGSRTVVLSHDVWKNNFSSDAHMLGRSVVLSDESYTVIGVMPAGFAFPVSNIDTSFWINDGKDAEGKNASMQQRGYNQLSVVGRLRPGVTVAQAKAEMDAIQSGLAARYADDDAKETAVSVIPQLDDLVAALSPPRQPIFLPKRPASRRFCSALPPLASRLA